MNFKTTIVLLVVLLVVGAYLIFTRDSGTTETKPVEHTLLDVKKEDLTKLTITPTDGKRTVLEKAGANWKLTEPVHAPADTFEASSLLDAITGLKSTNEVTDRSIKTGIDKPQYTVELTTGGKTVKLAIGDKLSVGNSVYVKVDGRDKVDVVSAEFLTKLEDPSTSIRDTKLVSASSTDIKQLEIVRKDAAKLVLHKNGNEWQIISPTTMPADSSAVSDILFAVTGLKAAAFESGDVFPPAMSEHPMTIFYSTQPAATQPTATAPAGTTIAFGRYQDVLKKNVYVQVSDSTAIATVTASNMDSFKKKPLELRDKAVVKIDPEKVSSIRIATDTPSTTQPATKPASHKEVVLMRRVEVATMGPVAPVIPAKTPPTAATSPATQVATTEPSTAPATQMAATKPVEPPTKWQITSDPDGDADDTKVTSLLSELNPLKADKFLERPATTQPSATYVLSITTGRPPLIPQDYEVTITDPGHDQPLVGSYNGLVFEVPRSLLTAMQAEFGKKPQP